MNDNGTNNKKMMWGFCGLWHYLVVLHLQTIDTMTYSHRCLQSPEAEWMNNGANKREKMLLLFFVDCDATWHVVSADHWHGAAQTGGAAGHIARQDAALLHARCLPRPWGWESVMADGHQPLFPDAHMNWRQSERGYTFVKISCTCSTLESLSFMKLGIIEGDAKVLCERQV